MHQLRSLSDARGTSHHRPAFSHSTGMHPPEVLQQKQYTPQMDAPADHDPSPSRMPAMEPVTVRMDAAMNIIGLVVAKLMRVEIAHSRSFSASSNRRVAEIYRPAELA